MPAFLQRHGEGGAAEAFGQRLSGTDHAGRGRCGGYVKARRCCGGLRLGGLPQKQKRQAAFASP